MCCEYSKAQLRQEISLFKQAVFQLIFLTAFNLPVSGLEGPLFSSVAMSRTTQIQQNIIANEIHRSTVFQEKKGWQIRFLLSDQWTTLYF